PWRLGMSNRAPTQVRGNKSEINGGTWNAVLAWSSWAAPLDRVSGSGKISAESASLDSFSGWSDPTIFIVYAHDNENLGDAKAAVVGRMIRWLQCSRCRVISDRSPLDPLPDALPDNATVRNILDSQFRLLPSSSDRESVAIVILCGSDVLEQYMRHPFTSSYLEKVQEAYKSAHDPRDKIRDVVEAHAGQAGFHHVLTEVAFLDIRKQAQKKDDGIISLALSGDLPSTYLEFYDRCNVVLKLKEEKCISNEHNLFFKLLYHVYPKEGAHSVIKEYEDCYNSIRDHFRQQAPNTMNAAKEIILPSLLSAAERIIENRTAKGRLAGFVNIDAERKLEEDRVRILGMLPPLPYLDRKNRNVIRAEDTCVWATTHPKLQQWQTASSSSVLWLSADPGCGKSVLARHLIDDVFPAASPTATICYFFFRDDFDDQRTLINALRCIVHQLFLQDPTLITQAVIDAFQRNNKLLSSEDGLWDIFLQAAQSNHSQEVLCVLDALDECPAQDRVIFIRQLSQFYRTNSTSRLKFLITSRPYSRIESDFRGMEPNLNTIHLAGENERELKQIEKEIDVVIKVRTRELQQALRLREESYTALLKGLTSVPNRTYLWVTLVLDVVKANIRKTRPAIEAILCELPQSVEAAYEKILSRADSQDGILARNIFQVILAATRPFSVLEMSRALAINGASKNEEQVQNETEDEFREVIRQLCGLFVIIVDSKVYFLHQTAKEFLLQKRAAVSPHRPITQRDSQWRHSLSLEDCHLFLGKICVLCLLLQPKESPSEDPSTGDASHTLVN
ncbi:NACHT and Ankyrin domain-containing protein, partial [Pyricularia oryzae Y34]